MDAKKDQSPGSQELIRQLQARARERAALRRDLQALEAQIHQRRRQSHALLVQKFADKAGVAASDLRAIQDEIHRRLEVQHRLVARGRDKIRGRTLDLVRKEAERRQAVRDRYLQLHAAKYRGREGNPELKFYTPVGHWAEHESPDRGMVGWGFDEPDLGEWNCSEAMEVDYDNALRGHHFYPRAYVYTGDLETPMTLRVEQVVVVRHDPLAAGRGPFRVDRVRADLSGVGYSRARMGDTCPLEMGLNIWDTTEASLTIRAHQFDAATGLFLEDEVLDFALPAGSGTHDQLVEVELATRPAAHDVLLDNNGSEIWLYVQLTTRVTAADEDGFAEVDFSREDTGGLTLGCITLIGEYD